MDRRILQLLRSSSLGRGNSQSARANVDMTGCLNQATWEEEKGEWEIQVAAGVDRVFSQVNPLQEQRQLAVAKAKRAADV